MLRFAEMEIRSRDPEKSNLDLRMRHFSKKVAFYCTAA